MASNTLEIIDRYTVLGVVLDGAVCTGDCEGTGFVPVRRDDDNPDYRRLWQEAEDINPTGDYHFVVCPTCNGTGKEHGK